MTSVGSHKPWFFYKFECVSCGWVKVRQRRFRRWACRNCNHTILTEGMVHHGCEKWHQEGTLCPSPYDVPLPPLTKLPDGSYQIPKCYLKDWEK